MSDISFSAAQADMRNGYVCGAPGILVSAVAWFGAGVVALLVSDKAAVLTLLAGGVVIHPLGVLIARGFGHRGSHAQGNPLGRLAIEGTFWLLAGIAIAFGMQVLRVDWFFPAMLLLIGGRYLTFQSLYGLRIYWVLGACLCVLGLVLALGRFPAMVSAFAGGAAEFAFALLVFRQSRILQQA